METATGNLYSRAVEYILMSPKTERQMRLWLKRKTDDADEIDGVVGKLKEYNFIDDADYAAQFIQCKKDKLGVGVIRNKLRVNGVKSAVIDRLIGETGSQYELAARKMEKYMHNKDRNAETKNKLFRHLAGKGFDFDLCGEVINENWDRY